MILFILLILKQIEVRYYDFNLNSSHGFDTNQINPNFMPKIGHIKGFETQPTCLVWQNSGEEI